MDHERYPYYFSDEDNGGRFIADLYEMLVSAFARLAAPAAGPSTVFARGL